MQAHDHGKWGCACWGADDQIGAANHLTPEKRRAALRSIDAATVYDLSHVFGADAPFMVPNQTPFLMSMWSTWRNSIRRRRQHGVTNDAGTNVERIEMTAHVGTHIDALGHVSKGDRLYNNLDASEILRPGHLGIARHHDRRITHAVGLAPHPAIVDFGRLVDRPVARAAHIARAIALAPFALGIAFERSRHDIRDGRRRL